MSKVQTLRVFVTQRLTAAAEEIFELFERTIAEYEEQLGRQAKLLDVVFKPEVQINGADVQQLPGEVDPPEQQGWGPSLNQEDPPEPPHIEEKMEELWTNQEEAEIIGFTLTPAPETKENPQSSQLHLTGVGGEDYVGPEPARTSDPTHYEISDSSEPETDNSDDWEPSSKAESGLHFLKNESKKLFGCPECGKQFDQSSELETHMRIHTREKPFSCPFCSRIFISKANLMRHMSAHTGEKPHGCCVCGKQFPSLQTLQNHPCAGGPSSELHQAEEDREAEHVDAEMSHSLFPEADLNCDGTTEPWPGLDYLQNNEEPVSDSEYNAGKMAATSFDHKEQDSLGTQTGEKPRRWTGRQKAVVDRMKNNSRGRHFSCPVCKKPFQCRGHVERHLRIHTGEKPFGCSVCGSRFNQKSTLTIHSRIHTGERPYVCSVCDASFRERGSLSKHMKTHVI